ncbi:MAG: threonine--tRNA ligase [Chloroflexota bacterium]
MIRITLPDGSQREVEHGTTPLAVAESIGSRLAKAAVAARVNGKVMGLTTPLIEDASLEILTFDSEEARAVYRHSSSHVLAEAVKHLFPGVKLGIGPAIADGFYYDFQVEKPFQPEDLEKIEAEANRIIKEDQPFIREELSREDAIALFERLGEPFKVELIEDLPADATITTYKNGDFLDLCAGPHLPNANRIKVFKILSVAGAYWRGDEKRPMLQRIYATSFEKKEQLDEYLRQIEEAKRRDHRKLGKELDLFSLHDEGPGFVFFHPKGMVIRNELEQFWRDEHRRRGYQEVRTPIILSADLWHQSGHWDHYKENMYFTKIDEMDYAIKPMNCPGGILTFKRKMYSYRDLPIRLAELGLVHRHELSGALHGLMRVRCFTQDDAHLFMLPEQIDDEVRGVMEFCDFIYKTFGFQYHVELSTRPENAMGSVEDWDRATQALRQAIEHVGVPYKINEGDGAFYGPKIDYHLRDSIGRTWQCATIQLDFQMPERFDLTYVGADGEKHRPVMVHRTLYGSIERFIGILTEEYAGAFPLWLAPVQVKILPITDRAHQFAKSLASRLDAAGLRVEIDDRNEKIGYKIREAEVEKVPYMAVIGDREAESGMVALRKRGKGDLGAMEVGKLLDMLKDEVRTKAR